MPKVVNGLITSQTKTVLRHKTDPLTFPKRTGGVRLMHCWVILNWMVMNVEQLTFGERQRILIGICIDSQVIEAIAEGEAMFAFMLNYSVIRLSVDVTEAACLVSFHN